jgi:cyclopropane-fatty-acyl-phospholipid synthase
MVLAPERQRPTRVHGDGLGAVIDDLLGDRLPIRIDCYDGTSAGPSDAPTRLIVHSPDAIRYILTAPGELGFARAYVAGQLTLEGDIFAALALREHVPELRLHSRHWVALARLIGATGVRRPPIPAEEAHLHGRRHTRARDAAAISHHYDVGNDFYRIVLGPSMTYSCAVWPSRDAALEDAQATKYDLVCQKLGLRPGMRLLDIGCGWGGMAMHAAHYYGVDVVGITLSKEQAGYAAAAAREAELDDRVSFRIQDYRDVRDEQFDAISSIGMFEHVGLARLREYFQRVHALLLPGGRFLNHAISRPPGHRPRFFRYGFIDRYVFPDGELHEIGSVVSAIQANGFEVRHVESLREHYALTLRQWVRNLEAQWDEAEHLAGSARARIWQLYMAASALLFEAGRISVHQTLAVRADAGRSAMPLRPDWH